MTTQIREPTHLSTSSTWSALLGTMLWNGDLEAVSAETHRFRLLEVPLVGIVVENDGA